MDHKEQSDLRAYDPNDTSDKGVTAFASTEEQFIEFLERWNGKRNIYIGVNERKPNTRGNDNVLALKTIYVDVDYIRPSGTSATEEQKAECHRTVQLIKKFCRANAFPEPLVADSGNGYSLFFPIKPTQNTTQNQMKYKQFGKLLQKEFNSENVKIDNVFNFERICKVFGTLSVKGKQRRLTHLVSDFSRRLESQSLTQLILGQTILEQIPHDPQEEPENPADIDKDKLRSAISQSSKLKQLVRGHWMEVGFPSRSEAEQSLVTLCLKHGLNKAETRFLLHKSNIGKAAEKQHYPSYFESMWRKAADFLTSIKDYEVQDLHDYYTEQGLFDDRVKPDQELTVTSDRYLSEPEEEDHNPDLPNPRSAAMIPNVTVNWVVPNFLPAGISIFAGQPGAGKSWLTLELCRAVTFGDSFCGQWPTEKGIAVYIDLEGEITETKQRALRLFDTIPDNLYFDDRCKLSSSYIQHMIQSYQNLENDQKVRLIVIDSLISAHNVKENSAEETNRIFREALFPLKEAFPHAAIILIHHIKKPNVTDERWTYLRGSGNILAQVRSAHVLLPIKNEGIALECVKMRVGKAPKDSLLSIEDRDNDKIEVVYKKELFAPTALTQVETCMFALLDWLKDVAKAVKEKGLPKNDAVRSTKDATVTFRNSYPDRIIREALIQGVDKGFFDRVKKGSYVYSGDIEIQKKLSHI